jgi:hypothetical protein
MCTGGPISWPLRSPDLSPLHFLSWSYVKNKLYSSKVMSIQHVGVFMATAELQVGCIPRYKRAHIKIVYTK